MKILLFGANGRTGREVIRQALTAGYSVTAVVRDKNKLTHINHDRLKVHIGNVCDYRFLENILADHDAVISTLGPRKPTKDACEIYSKSMTAIIKAMQNSHVNRLLVCSTALLFPTNTFLERFLRWIAKNNFVQAGLMEDLIKSSSLDWTIARTGFLNNKNYTAYRIAVGAFPERGGAISREALANFLLTEAKKSVHLHQIVGLCTHV